MEKTYIYLLYFFRVTILVLFAWLFFVLFSPAINKHEAAFQQSLIQNQITNNKLLNKYTTTIINDLEDLVQKHPLDTLLPNTYRLAEKECNLALDTIDNLFSNQNISNQELTTAITKILKNLNENIWMILKKFEQESPIIKEEEILHFYKMLPQFSYSVQRKNRALIKSLAIGKVEEIKAKISPFVSFRFCSITSFDSFYPIINTSIYKKNQRSTIKVFFSPNGGEQIHIKSLDINNTSISFKDGIASYKTIFNDNLSQQLIVNGALEIDYQSITLQDTFIIHPTQKH